MKTVAHSNIATFYGASYHKPSPQHEALITIFYERLEPSEPIILIQKGAKATHFQRLKYLHQVSLGLSYLAGMKIYHGDIKLGNLLYDRKGDKFKLCDWGFAKDLRSNSIGPAKGEKNSFFFFSKKRFPSSKSIISMEKKYKNYFLNFNLKI